MSPVIEIATRTLGPTLEIESSEFVFKLPARLASSYGEIQQAASAAGGELSGMPFARYLDIDWEAEARRGGLATVWHMLTSKIHFSTGRFVTAPIEAAPPVVAHDYPARQYLVTHHIGPYSAVGKTYKRLMAHASDNGLALQSESFEHYIEDPTTKPKDELRTEVLIPLAGDA